MCLYTMLSISLSVDECRTAALPGVCLCALHMCKIPSGYVSKFVKPSTQKVANEC